MFLYSEDETDMLVRDRGLLYYRLLKTDVHEAKRIICGSQKMISNFTSPPKAVRHTEISHILEYSSIIPRLIHITIIIPIIL